MFAYTLYYSDDSTPSVTQCTGDAYEYASSGPWIDMAIPNTDPYLGDHYIFQAHRTVYFDGPGQTVPDAIQHYNEATIPLQGKWVTAAGRQPPPANKDRLTSYPNPFSAGTRISFSLAESGKADVRVYDVSGKLVKNLFSGAAGQLETNIHWNRHNNRGLKVGSGIYFLRLEAGRGQLVRKMVVVD